MYPPIDQLVAPAEMGVQSKGLKSLGSRFRGNDEGVVGGPGSFTAAEAPPAHRRPLFPRSWRGRVIAG
jgi:hypothetical protein